ncbi:MAG TPA: flotillin-like FloA family protein [Planctomycetota bacterium]
MQCVLTAASTNLFTIVIACVLLLLLGLVLYLARFLNLWIQATMSGVPVPLVQLIGMRLRKVDPTTIVRARIMAKQATLSGVDWRDLEAHFVAGGDVVAVVQGLIVAHRAGVPLEFRNAAALDLAGRNVADAVQALVDAEAIARRNQGSSSRESG